MKRCGYIALVGRPNVGKSTLLNQLLEQKISITARKPQTTRQQILGIKTTSDTQFIFVDTPGIHRQGKLKLNRYMNQTAMRALVNADVVVLLVEAGKWLAADQWVLDKLHSVTAMPFRSENDQNPEPGIVRMDPAVKPRDDGCAVKPALGLDPGPRDDVGPIKSLPIILVINKIDQMTDQRELLPFIDDLRIKFAFTEIVPIAAKKNINVAHLQQTLARYLPENPHFYTPEQITDRSERFLAAEFVREQLMRHLGQEVPYGATVMIEQFKHEATIIRISATILVARRSHKAIIIGKRGELLKKIGSLARVNLEKLLGQKVFLQLWVKVKAGWADDEQALRDLGYGK